MEGGGGARSAQVVREYGRSLRVVAPGRAASAGVTGSPASRLTANIQLGFAAASWVGPEEASFSIGTLLQQSAVLPGELHSVIWAWQQAMAAGPVSSQKSTDRGDPTRATARRTVASPLSMCTTLAHVARTGHDPHRPARAARCGG